MNTSLLIVLGLCVTLLALRTTLALVDTQDDDFAREVSFWLTQAMGALLLLALCM